jgi:hypothetical protein
MRSRQQTPRLIWTFDDPPNDCPGIIPVTHASQFAT